jgi:multidrug resistance efflux pump
MHVLSPWLIKNALVVGVVAVVVLAALTYVFFSKEEVRETRIITRGLFVQDVSISGKVVAPEDVSMAFEHTGRVDAIYVEVGDIVSSGDPLVSLSLGTLSAELRSAEADVAVKRLEALNSSVNLEEVTATQDTLVANALRTLLSSGLSAVSASSGEEAAPPLISGLYGGTEEGRYKFSISRKQINSGDYELRTFELERTEPIEILNDEPTALGTRGLFVSFPDALSEYDGTGWYISIPNVKSSLYLTNYNAYQEALQTRAKAIADAQARLSKRNEGQTIAEAELLRAEAEVARLRTEVEERTLRTPFSGVVSRVDAKLGGAVSINDSMVSLLSEGELLLESYVPEINITHIKVGNPASITLDAYGEGTIFFGTVISIDPAETIRDSVSTYRVKLHFDTEDERVRSGMTSVKASLPYRREVSKRKTVRPLCLCFRARQNL